MTAIFCFIVAFLSIYQLFPHSINKGMSLMMEPGILLPLPVSNCVVHVLYKVPLHAYSGTGEYLIECCGRPQSLPTLQVDCQRLWAIVMARTGSYFESVNHLPDMMLDIART